MAEANKPSFLFLHLQIVPTRVILCF